MLSHSTTGAQARGDLAERQDFLKRTTENTGPKVLRIAALPAARVVKLEWERKVGGARLFGSRFQARQSSPVVVVVVMSSSLASGGSSWSLGGGRGGWCSGWVCAPSDYGTAFPHFPLLLCGQCASAANPGRV